MVCHDPIEQKLTKVGFIIPVKSYSIYAHRQTHSLHPYGQDKIFYTWKFIPFHFTKFILSPGSLIHSVCEG